MYSESSKLERPSHSLPLDSFHDAEGLPIPSPFDSRPERPAIFTGDHDEDGPHSSTFASPDIEQKISQHLLEEQSADLRHTGGFDFYHAPAAPSSLDTGDFSSSPAAMFLSAFSPISSQVAQTPDAEGELVSGYKLGPVIGYGGFSTIRRASSSSGGIVAVKIVRRSDVAKQPDAMQARQRLDHEASIWITLSHEHILPLFSAVHTPYADFFVTLFCPAGSLFDILKRDGTPALPQDDAGMMFRQVVRGLRYLHEVAQLVHRDIKLENVLVDEMGVCRIGDFGMSRNIGDVDADDVEGDDDDDVGLPLESHQSHPHRRDDGLLSQSSSRAQSQGVGVERRATSYAQARPKPKRQAEVGKPVHLSMFRHHSGPRHRNSTPTGTSTMPSDTISRHYHSGSLPYAAPELLTHQFAAPLKADPAQDMWALGVMLFVLLTGRLPFMDTFEPRLQMKILHGMYPLSLFHLKLPNTRLSLGVYDIPTDIGQGAELVLQGCIERSVASRWTIAMVDEVAWGVGWGAEGSPSSPEDEIEILQDVHQSASRSLSRRRTDSSGSPAGSGTSSMHSLDAARRRSTSRARRSRSRASVISDRSMSMSTRISSTSRSVSRNSHLNSALTDSMISTNTASSISSLSYDIHHESALVTSPPSRGRRARNVHTRSTSRSPSPSVAPLTPLDLLRGRSLPPDEDVAEASSRGRKQYPGDIATPRQVSASYTREGLDSVDETTGWDRDGRKSGLLSQLSRRLNPRSYLSANSAQSLRGRNSNVGNSGIIRAGSTPPAAEDVTAHRFSDTPGAGGFLRNDSSTSTSLGVPVARAARSRSVGYDN